MSRGLGVGVEVPATSNMDLLRLGLRALACRVKICRPALGKEHT